MANNTVTMTVDTVVPTIAITSNKASLKAGETATITLTLSESSTDFTSADLTVSGGTVSDFSGSGTSYTATFTPAANSTTNGVISLASDKFSDAAGNFNADGSESNNSLSMTLDTVPPSVAITTNKIVLKPGETAAISFTLSEPSSDFTLGDILVAGGSLSSFTGSGSFYSAAFIPDPRANSVGLVAVNSALFTDSAGNANVDPLRLVLKPTALSSVHRPTQFLPPSRLLAIRHRLRPARPPLSRSRSTNCLLTSSMSY